MERTWRLSKNTRRYLEGADPPPRLSDTKNTSQRTVPLNQRATEVFRLAMGNPASPKDTPLVFFGDYGKDGQRGPYEFWKTWQRIRRELGLQELHFHACGTRPLAVWWSWA